jgi:hypothetical protein
VLCRGGSVIVSPLGDVPAGPAFGEETVLHAELDLDRITEGKYDGFTLRIDERPRPLSPSSANRRRRGAAERASARRSRGNIRGNIQIVHYVHCVQIRGRNGRYGRIRRI